MEPKNSICILVVLFLVFLCLLVVFGYVSIESIISNL